MMNQSRTIKKSVTIDADILDSLGPDRTVNLSATVNESLRLVAALDLQRSLVESWEKEQGRAFSDEELRPYMELVLNAEARHRADLALLQQPASNAG
jgi:post-segregation antitoxin (ccd killing protein)